ncbi:hypothetical protein TNCV_1054851 [Trichonephila clavipes]|nr:hypothetical protein TNCV_1054851 [Trichonephila clavipes]
MVDVSFEDIDQMFFGISNHCTFNAKQGMDKTAKNTDKRRCSYMTKTKEKMMDFPESRYTCKVANRRHEDSPRQDKIICSMQTLPRSSTHAQSRLGMPNRRNKVTKNGNGRVTLCGNSCTALMLSE